MSAAYDGKQFVGIDLHRRRSVICRTDQQGTGPAITEDFPQAMAALLARAASTQTPS